MTPEDQAKLANLELQVKARGMPLIELEVTPDNWIGQLEQTKGEPYSKGKQTRIFVALLAQKAARVHEIRISEFGVWATVDYAPFLDNAARALQEKRISLTKICSQACALFEAEQTRSTSTPK